MVKEVKIEKSEKILKIFPWYSGLSEGTLFYTAISTLFLTIVKGLSSSQIAMLGTIATLLCILLQKIILKIIKKIGNTCSIRLGTFLLLLSVLLVTFGNYYTIILGSVLELVAFTFKDMENIILKNNLKVLNRSEEYMKYKNKAFLVYSIATAIIALIASYLFILNNYLPMLFCILFCVITLIMSFYINDVKVERKFDENVTNKTKEAVTLRVLGNKLILYIIISFGVIRTCIALGFNNTQLFIQYDLQDYFDLTKTTYYLGIIIFSSRIVRILSNISFDNIYKKFKDKLIYLIPISLLISFMLLLFSHFVVGNLLLKFTLMGISYGIILYIIDSFTAVVQDVLLKGSNENKHQSILTYLSFSYKLFKTIFGFIVSLILLRYSLVYVFIFLIILISIGVLSMKKIYNQMNNYDKNRIVSRSA